MPNHYLLNGHTPIAPYWYSVTPNLMLLDAVIDQIHAHPELHNQLSYCRVGECVTAYCVAGWAVKLAYPEAVFLINSGSHGANYVRLYGETVHISNLAREVLGLTSFEADYLFHPHNQLEEIEAAVKEWHNNQRLVRRVDEVTFRADGSAVLAPVWEDQT